MSEINKEKIPLPSKGYVYPKESPLSQGFVEMRWMDASDEDVLTNPNNIKDGVTSLIDILLKQLIVTPNVNIDDLLEGDRTQLLIAAKILSSGNMYQFEMKSLLNDDKVVTQEVDLAKLKDVEIDFNKFKKGENRFEFKLPNSGAVIEFKLLTHGDIKKIVADVNGLYNLYKKSFDVTTRLRYQIISVNGDTNQGNIKKFADKMLTVDTKAFRKYYKSLEPRVDNTFTYVEDNYTEEGVTFQISLINMFFRD